ncbi:MAG: tyrosine-protein phosphatase [Treponema sp.]|jgi:protein-tyrosine phosphatase|nr:tyrosine-protein phosphatase [Treponema sp.]
METNTAAALALNQQRIIPFKGIPNARELGTCRIAAGGSKQVKRGLLYRSGELAVHTDRDRRILEELGIKTVVDFRSEEEKKISPEVMPGTVRRLEELPIDAGNLMGTLYSAEEGWTYASTASGAVADMEKLYTALPQEALEKYRVLFSLLADPENAPLLFHCSAGKDRTGLAAALVLHALGADRETVMEDYLLSALCLRERLLSPGVDPRAVPYWTVQESYLRAAFVKIEDYGGMDRYIAGELGADVEHLRKLYTE